MSRRSPSVIGGAHLGNRTKRRAEVSPHALQSGTLERSITKAVLELLFAHVLEKSRAHAGRPVSGLELGDAGRLGEALIPGTDVVADVAPEGVALEAID